MNVMKKKIPVSLTQHRKKVLAEVVGSEAIAPVKDLKGVIAVGIAAITLPQYGGVYDTLPVPDNLIKFPSNVGGGGEPPKYIGNAKLCQDLCPELKRWMYSFANQYEKRVSWLSARKAATDKKGAISPPILHYFKGRDFDNEDDVTAQEVYEFKYGTACSARHKSGRTQPKLPEMWSDDLRLEDERIGNARPPTLKRLYGLTSQGVFTSSFCQETAATPYEFADDSSTLEYILDNLETTLHWRVTQNPIFHENHLAGLRLPRSNRKHIPPRMLGRLRLWQMEKKIKERLLPLHGALELAPSYYTHLERKYTHVRMKEPPEAVERCIPPQQKGLEQPESSNSAVDDRLKSDLVAANDDAKDVPAYEDQLSNDMADYPYMDGKSVSDLDISVIPCKGQRLLRSWFATKIYRPPPEPMLIRLSGKSFIMPQHLHMPSTFSYSALEEHWLYNDEARLQAWLLERDWLQPRSYDLHLGVSNGKSHTYVMRMNKHPKTQADVKRNAYISLYRKQQSGSISKKRLRNICNEREIVPFVVKDDLTYYSQRETHLLENRNRAQYLRDKHSDVAGTFKRNWLFRESDELAEWDRLLQDDFGHYVEEDDLLEVHPVDVQPDVVTSVLTQSVLRLIGEGNVVIPADQYEMLVDRYREIGSILSTVKASPGKH